MSPTARRVTPGLALLVSLLALSGAAADPPAAPLTSDAIKALSEGKPAFAVSGLVRSQLNVSDWPAALVPGGDEAGRGC